jgi:hypothetical protein
MSDSPEIAQPDGSATGAARLLMVGPVNWRYTFVLRKMSSFCRIAGVTQM